MNKYDSSSKGKARNKKAVAKYAKTKKGKQPLLEPVRTIGQRINYPSKLIKNLPKEEL